MTVALQEHLTHQFLKDTIILMVHPIGSINGMACILTNRQGALMRLMNTVKQVNFTGT